MRVVNHCINVRQGGENVNLLCLDIDPLEDDDKEDSKQRKQQRLPVIFEDAKF